SGPFVWSETRQELCESLSYYRAYQTGCYTAMSTSRATAKKKDAIVETSLTDNVPYGYLLAGWPSKRDAWACDGRVVISHGGGKNDIGISAKTPGSSSVARGLMDDQSDDAPAIRALLHAIHHQLPVVLIAANSYALLPFRLNCAYAVLGWYNVTDSWAERETQLDIADVDSAATSSPAKASSFVRWKFRFEWVEAQGKPWWTLPGVPNTTGWNPRSRLELFTAQQLEAVERTQHSRGSKKSRKTFASLDRQAQLALLREPARCAAKVVSSISTDDSYRRHSQQPGYANCERCNSLQPTVFTVGWICLNVKCPSFFRRCPNESLQDQELEFCARFLQPRGDRVNGGFMGEFAPFSIIPNKPPIASLDQARGQWCENCGRLSCRETIIKPTCPHCGKRVGNLERLRHVAPPVLKHYPLGLSDKLIDSINDPVVSATAGIQMTVERRCGLLIYSFAFGSQFGDSRVHMVQADVEGGQPESEANLLFRQFQLASWPPPRKKSKAKKQRKQRRDVETAIETLTNQHDCWRTWTLPVSGAFEPPQSIKRIFSDSIEDAAELVPFRRHALKHHAAGSVRMLTQQFTCNYGVPYKHVVAMGTEPLDDTAPEVIRSTLHLLRHRTEAVVGSLEKALGGQFNELYPVLYLEHQKMSFHDDGEPGLGPVVSSLSLGSACTMRFRLKRRYEAAYPEIKRSDTLVLKLPLRHGSVVIQQGHDLQKFFEHSVTPVGFRIAVTARRIDESINSR
ncbi:hypothetical protein BCV70DRAFT_146695, partial [Testicularia cyperi]